MRSFWSDPYLWIHLAGLATLPIWLEFCLLALAVGDPILPPWLELFLVAGIGITPILWMQWVRPFDIYSLLAVSLQPEQLDEDQRKLLTLFTAPRNRVLAIAVPVLLAIALQKLYWIAPIAAAVTPFAGAGRVGALLLAAIAFLGANLFTQVPVAVLSVLFTSETTFAATLPFAPDQIRQSFTLLGFPVNQILPPLVSEPTPAIAPPTPVTSPPQFPTTPATGTVTGADIEDIWGESEDELPAIDSAATTGSEIATDSETAIDSTTAIDSETATVEISAPSEQPEEKPDLPVEEVKEEVAIAPELAVGSPVGADLAAEADSPRPETVLIAEADLAPDEASWLDAAPVDDPATAEPPNSL